MLEVLLVLALIALLGGVLVSTSANLLSEQPVTPDDVFWKAVQQARKAALRTEHEVRLRYDKEKKSFLVIDGLNPTRLEADGITRTETALKEISVPAKSAGDLTVDFLPTGTKGGNLILVGGVAIESKAIPFVTFFPDGTCTAFRAQFFRNGAVFQVGIDPWTCAQMLIPADPNAPKF